MKGSSMTVGEIVQQIRPIEREWVARARERTAKLAIPPRGRYGRGTGDGSH